MKILFLSPKLNHFSRNILPLNFSSNFVLPAVHRVSLVDFCNRYVIIISQIYYNEWGLEKRPRNMKTRFLLWTCICYFSVRNFVMSTIFFFNCLYDLWCIHISDTQCVYYTLCTLVQWTLSWYNNGYFLYSHSLCFSKLVFLIARILFAYCVKETSSPKWEGNMMILWLTR